MVLLIRLFFSIFRGRKFILSPLFFLLILTAEAKEDIIFYSSDCPKCRETARKFTESFSEDFNIIFADTRIPAVRQEMREKARGKIIFPPCAFYQGKLYAGDELFTILMNDITGKISPSESESIISVSGSILTLLIAGFLDGINPCALTVIIFFISAAVRSKIKISLPLFFLICGIFSFYLLIGIFGIKLLSIFYYSSFFSILNTLLLTVTAALFFLSLTDLFLFFRVKKIGFFSLPRKNILYIHRKIKAVLKIKNKKNLCLSAFAAGMLISLFELLCTGQIYLPVLNMIVQKKGKNQAVMMLILYNLAFIIPLITASATSKHLFSNIFILKNTELIFRIMMPLLFIWLFYMQL